MTAVDVGHFTHFAFTVNFTHCVKTKPDSGFTVKSITNPDAAPRAGGLAPRARVPRVSPIYLTNLPTGLDT